ncbi:hypothetical protein [Niveispirillum sp. BGYR6]|nr:hypothetical protein [Niveispirillum sp. BGYR6]MDG5496196.1 hypothetical protein [Niveispirillum sp. BGYR6]
MPDQLWLSDFMYVSAWSGFVYVAFIIDWTSLFLPDAAAVLAICATK